MKYTSYQNKFLTNLNGFELRKLRKIAKSSLLHLKDKSIFLEGSISYYLSATLSSHELKRLKHSHMDPFDNIWLKKRFHF